MRLHSMKIVVTMAVMALVGSCGGQKDEDGSELPENSTGPVGLKAGMVISSVNMGDVGTDGAVIERGKNPAGVEAETGNEVLTADVVRVGDKGGVMIELVASERVALNSGSVVRVESQSKLELQQGEIWVQGGFTSGEESLKVRAGTNEVEMKSANGSVRMDEGELSVALVSGSAEIAGGDSRTSVVAGQELTLDSGGRVVLRPVGDAGNLVAWTEALRDEVAKASAGGDEEEIEGAEVVRGIGTMAAKAPGSSNLLPFEVLSQDVTVRIQDQVAVTRIEQVFKNPTGTTVEGLYKFPIPAGSKLTRYDMEIGGKLMQGEIVEKKRGRMIMKKVIDDFLYLMRDPALVEWESGSTFKTRIFPIKAKEKKRIVMSYMQTLDGEAGRYRYVLPVASAGTESPAIPAFRIDAKVAGAGGEPIVHTPLYESVASADGRTASVGFEAKDFTPPVDFVIEIEQEKRADATLVTYSVGDEEVIPMKGSKIGDAVKAGDKDEKGWDYFMLSVSPDPGVSGDDLSGGTDWIFMVDTSQSRTAIDMQVQANLVEAMVGALSSRDRVKVMAFDVFPRAMSEGWEMPSYGLLERVHGFLREMPAGGATNLDGALRKAARMAKDGEDVRVVLVGDGAASLGERRAAQLADIAEDLFEEMSITTVGVGSSVDDLLMRELSRRTGGQFHYISSGEDLLRSAVRVISTLRLPVLSELKFELSGVETKDVTPAEIPNVGVGQEVTITGRYRGTGEMSVLMSASFGDREFEKAMKFEVGEGKKANSFVPLTWAASRIDDLTLEDDEDSVKEIVALSKRFSIPSRHTSFIVLENKKMYQEFGVKQTGDRLEWEGTDEIEYEASAIEAAMADGEMMDEDMPMGGGIVTASKAGGGAKKAKGAMPSMKKPSSASMKSAPKMDMVMDSPLEYWDPPHYKHKSCGPMYSTSVTALLPDVSEKKIQSNVDALKEDVEKKPLHRLYRRKLVKYLMKVGRYDEATEQMVEWQKLDGADDNVLQFMGDLARLGGDSVAAVRYYSGVLDNNPEKRLALENLARMFESREMWDAAYASRLSLHLAKPLNNKYIAQMAVAASKAGRAEDAMDAALLIVDESKAGTFVTRKGVKLSAEMREAMFRVAAGEKLPLGFGSVSLADAGSAKLKVELTWKGDADLDLWVATTGGKFLGGDKQDGKIVHSAKGSAGEVAYIKSPSGNYRIQVQCASGDCGNVAGKVKINIKGTKKTIPFVLEDGQGLGIAEVKHVRRKVKC